MAVRREPPADLVPAELLTFDLTRWGRSGEARWVAIQRWSDARKAWIAAHPESTALGNKLERFQLEFETQFPHAVRGREQRG